MQKVFNFKPEVRRSCELNLSDILETFMVTKDCVCLANANSNNTRGIPKGLHLLQLFLPWFRRTKSNIKVHAVRVPFSH